MRRRVARAATSPGAPAAEVKIQARPPDPAPGAVAFDGGAAPDEVDDARDIFGDAGLGRPDGGDLEGRRADRDG
jgi:hypothetical protein